VATTPAVERAKLGAQIEPQGVRFRVWAPKRRRVSVVLEPSGRVVPLEPEEGGYFSGLAPDVAPGALYRYRLDDGRDFPDPCSRYQPQGPHGPSMVVDPDAYRWRDDAWRGVTMHGHVFYELHVGAFTREGTLDAAAAQLPELARLGITAVELMPLAEFPGRFNWGYDGVDLYAPAHVYGDADALKRFVDAAHSAGVAVVLDVVYNHLGPDGNYLREYSDDYFTDRYDNEWGDALNFDGPGSEAVREHFVENACYWVREFHLDGLRLDATQQIFDTGPRHILAEISVRARAAAAPRSIVLIAENEPQDVIAMKPVAEGGWGLDAEWSDDFHHSARVALTGRREAYYSDYTGRAQELLSCVKRGHLYQGQYYGWQRQGRGTPVTNEPASAFVFYLQNHDQVANHLRGERLTPLAGAARSRAMTALLLLAPQTPLLFMGQELASSRPFLYFADHADPKLAEAVFAGRKKFLAQFPSYARSEAQDAVPDPCAPETFAAAKLDLAERETHAADYALHHDLLRLRREDPVIARQSRHGLDGAVLGSEALAVRYSGGDDGDRLLVLNLGRDLDLISVAEPLLAPPAGGDWTLHFSTDDPKYGGPGMVPAYSGTTWRLPAGSAQLFVSTTPGGPRP
jgi:maltooligosyltrehalose trehalohydrolase